MGAHERILLWTNWQLFPLNELILDENAPLPLIKCVLERKSAWISILFSFIMYGVYFIMDICDLFYKILQFVT